MWPAWLRHVARTLTPRPHAPYRKPRSPRLRLEQFEERVVPATITWTGGAGTFDWLTAGNWDLNRLPNVGDDVTIPDLGTPGPDVTIRLVGGSSVNSLTTSENVVVTGSGVNLAGTLTVTGDIVLDATLTLESSGGANGTATLNFSAPLGTVSQQVTTATAGKILLSGAGRLQQAGTAHTVTVGSGVTVSATDFGSNIIGLGAGGTWANQGTFSNQGPGELVFASNVNTAFHNQPGGVWEANTGGTLTFAPGSSWDNDGTIRVNGGTVNLGGDLTTANLGTISRTGGTVNITGTVDNTGSTLNLGGVGGIGPVTLDNGTIVGGVIDATNGAALAINRGTLDGVTINGAVEALANNEIVTIRSGLVLNGTFTLGGNLPVLDFEADAATDNQRITTNSSALLSFTGTSANRLRQQGASHTVTFGPGVTVSATSGATTLGYIPGGVVGTWVNEGTVTAPAGSQLLFTDFAPGNVYRNDTGGVWEAAGGAFTTAATVENEGTIRISAGTMTLAGAWTNDGTVTIAGGTLTLAGTWSSPGAIALTGGTLNLGGSFSTASLDNFSRAAGGTAGTVNLTGTVNNTGATLTLDNTRGSWNFAGGTINGGTFAIAPGSTAKLTATTTGASQSFLTNGVTLNSPIDFSVVNAQVQVSGGLTLNTTMSLSNATGSRQGILQFNGTQTLRTDTAGTILIPGGNSSVSAVNGVLTIGPGVTIRGGAGTVNGTNNAIVNKGTIISEVSGQTLEVFIGNGGRNEGTIQATSGGGLKFHTNSGVSSWTNLGTISLTGGTHDIGRFNETWTNLGSVVATNANVNLFGQLTPARIGSFTRTGGTVTIGILSTITGDLTLDDSTGSWIINGVSVINSRIRTFGSAKLVATGSSNRLQNCILDGQLDMTTFNGSNVEVSQSFTLNTTLQVGAANGSTFGQFALRNIQTITGTGTFVFGGHGQNHFGGNGTSPVITIDSGLTLRGRTVRFAALGGLINKGTIASDGGGSFDVFPPTFTNLGTVRVGANSEMVLHPGAMTNFTDVTQVGSIRTGSLTGGNWYVGPNALLRFYLNILGFQFNRVNASLTLDGPNSRILGGQAGFSFTNLDALLPLEAVGGDGTLTITNGRSINGPRNFTNAGQLVVGHNSTFDLAGVPTNGLVTRYLAEGNADDSIGTNHGTPVNGTTFTAGRVNQAFSFDGVDDYIDVGDRLDMGPSDFTLSVWIKGDPTMQDWGRILDKGFNTGFTLGRKGNTGQVGFEFRNSGSQGNNFSTTSVVIDNTWHHVVVVKQAGQAFIYADGNLENTQNVTTLSQNNALPLYIGYNPGEGTRGHWKGALDEIAIYTRALSAAEVQNLYNLGTLGTFTQTGGTTTIDETANLFSGTPAGKTVQLLAGTLRGTGTINANVVNGATITPGASPGFLDVTGDYTQTPGGVLLLELAGRDPNVPQFDRLRVTGAATLDGTARVELLDGFEPTPGDEFRVLSAASRAGQFATHEFPAPGGALRRLAPVYDATGLTLQAQQLPPVNFGYATTQQAVGGGIVLNNDVALDASGNAYVTGKVFTGTIDFDGEGPAAPITTTAGSAAYVAKFDPSGGLLWVRLLESSGAEGTGIAVDPTTGDVVATGWFLDSATITDGVNSTTLTDPGVSPNGSAFVARLTSDGELVWARSTTGAGSERGEDVAVASGGTAYVVGLFDGTADFDPGAGTANLAATGADAFVWALDASGNLVAVDQLGGNGIQFALGVAATGAGASDVVWVTGFTTGATTGLATLTPAAAGSEDIFVLKLARSGGSFTSDPAVAAVYGSAGRDNGTDLAVASDGSAVLSGFFEFEVDFDKSATSAFTLVSGGDNDAFMLKLGAGGAFAWARGFGGYRGDAANDIALDPADNVYLTGTFFDFVDFDPLDGSYIRQATDDQAFVAKYTPDGAFGWAADLTAPPGSASFAYGVAAGADGRVVTAGHAISNPGGADFDPTDGVNTPIPSGEARGYVWALNQKAAPVAAIVGLPAAAVSEGSTLALAASVADADSSYFSYSWSVARDGVQFATGTGPAFAAHLPEQGSYAVTLVVTDESGNRDARTATVAVTNGAPALNPTAFAAPVTFAASAGAADNIPSAVATGGGFVLLGVSRRDAGGADAGAVDVYTAAGAFVRTLASPAPVAGGRFGAALAVAGSHAVVGEPGSGAGAVHVFDLATGALVRTIAGPGAAAGDQFGAALAAVGSFAAVGAPGRAADGAAGAGAAYLYDPATGALLQTFRNPTPQAGDGFGAALVAVGGHLLVGAPRDDSAGLDAGAAYLFDPALARVARTILNPNPTFPGSNFGAVLAASGLRAAVGAPLDDSAGTDAGGVYLFDLDPSSAGFGVLTGTFRGPAGGKFGTSLAFAGNRLLVGAEADGITVANSGGAFLMDADPGSATFGNNLRTFKKATPAAGDRFGAVVAFAGNDVLVGAPQDDLSATDAGRVYRFNATAFLTPTPPNLPENGTLTVSGSFADPGAGDAHTVVIDWADGTVTRVPLAPGVNTFGAAHRYLDDGPSPGNNTASDNYAVRVRVLDGAPDVAVADLDPAAPDAILRFDGATGTPLGTLVAPSASGVAGATEISGVALGPDGVLFVAYQGGGNPVVRFDPVTGANLGVFIAAAPSAGAGGSRTNNLAFGPDGIVAIYDAAAGYFRRFDGRTGAPVAPPAGSGSAFNDPNPTGGSYSPRGWTFGPGGDLFVGNAAALAVERFDGATGAYLGAFTNSAALPLASPTDLAFGPTGDLYVMADGVASGTRVVAQIDGATGAFVREFQVRGSASGNDGFLVTPDGTVVVQDDLGTVTRFDPATGEPLGTLFAPPTGGLVAGGLLFDVSPQSSATASATVTNAPPVVVVRAAPAAPGQYSLTAVAADSGSLDGLTFSWTITGGVPVGPTNGPTFTFTPTGAAISVLLTLTDDDTAVVTTRTQIVIGTPNPDTIFVNETNANVNGLVIPYAAGTSRVIAYGLAGDDTISAANITVLNIPVQLIGGFGNDTLTGGVRDDVLTGNNPGDYALADPYTGDTGNDSLAAGAGNDTLDGGLGNDTMAGGVGSDHYQEVPGSADLLTEAGASGTDTIDYSLAFSGISFSLGVTGPQSVDAAGDTVEIQGTFENLSGSTHTDRLSGNSLDNVIAGGGGDDAVYGDARDFEFGGVLLDTLASIFGDGNDTLTGGQGGNTVVGGAGNDIIFGGDLLATIPGFTAPTSPAPDTGSNSLIGGTGNDTVVGGTGNDIIFGGDLLATLPGLPGSGPVPSAIPDNDSIIGGAGNDTVVGGTGNDIIFGGDLLATVSGGTSSTPSSGESNTLIGGQGADTVVGGTGNDIIFGGDLLATVSGGTSPTPVPDTSPNSLIGGTGNDTIVGGTGNDIIFGGDLLATVSGGSSPTPTAPESNTLIGGQGADTVVGGTGNDIIFGGDLLATLPGFTAPPTPPAPDTSPNSLIGGSGNDTIVGGTGNDIIFGGDLLATVQGATGTPTTAGADDDSLVGGSGNDTVVGGTGNDIIFGGDLLATLPGFTAPPAAPIPDTSPNSLIGGTGNDTVVGGTGNDIIFGGEGDDALTGGAGNDLFEGGSGTDTVVETADADFTLTPTQLVTGGSAERFFDLERAVLSGGAGSNRLDASAFTGPVVLSGGDGNDTLVGGPGGDLLLGGAGNDSLVGLAGADVLDPGSGSDASDGGTGNDTFVLQLDGLQTLADPAGIDSIDLSASAFGVSADLNAGTVKFTGLEAAVATLGGSFENLRGTGLDDVLVGNPDRNILEGGGGIDQLDGSDGADTVQGSFPQVVYLDFDSGTGKGEHVYTVEERNQIQDRLEKAFSAPFSVGFTQTAPAVGRFSTVVFNAGEAEALVAGVSDELDWRNVNAASRAEVNVNGFLGRAGQPAATGANYVGLTFTVTAHEIGHLLGLRHSDALGPIGSGIYAGMTARVTTEVATPVLSAPAGAAGSTVYAMRHPPVLFGPVTQEGNTQPNAFTPPSGTVFVGDKAVATFALDPATPAGAVAGTLLFTPVGSSSPVAGGFIDSNTGGLVLQWSSVPASSSVRATYQYDPFRPGYRGPDDAAETPHHVMASPASVGSTLAHAAGATHFGQRELIKLSFDDASSTAHEAALGLIAAPASVGAAQARDLGVLPGLALPTPATPGGHAQVRATNVLGAIALAGGVSENDVYSFLGQAGDYLTAEVLSESLRQRLPNVVDSVVRVYDAGGVPLDYHGLPAVNDDGFDNPDAILLDVRLPATGRYFVTVDTFTSAAVPDTDTGGYELFLYTYTPAREGAARLGGAGDLLTGGAGADVLIGTAGDDRFDGDLAEDTFIGFVPELDRAGPANTPPEVVAERALAVAEDGSAGFVAGTDAEGDALTAAVTRHPLHGTVAFDPQTATFTYTPDANFHGADSFAYTLTDGTETSAEANVAVTVTPVNDAPTSAAGTASTAEDTPVVVDLAPLVADVETADADLVYTVTESANATVTPVAGQPGRFAVTPAPNFHGRASFAYTVSDGAATSAPAAVLIDVSAVNDAPAAADDAHTTDEDVPLTVAAPGVLGNDTDVEGDALSAVLVSGPSHGTLTLNGNGSFTYTPAANYNGSDSFTYKANDGALDSNTATVSITVNAVNDVPTAAADGYTTDEDTPLSVAAGGVLLNDEDIDGDSLTAELVSGPAHGTFVLNADGSFTYTPDANFNGTDSFTYRARDGGAASAPATVTITVRAVNDAPTAAAQSAATDEDTDRALVLAGDDGDPELTQALTFAIASGPAHGTLVGFDPASGAVTYRPDPNYFGPDSFTFTAADGQSASAAATVTLNVVAVNDAPTAANDAYSVAEDATLAVAALGVLGNDADVEGDALTAALVDAPRHGTLSLAADGSLVYTPNANFHGTDSFTYRASDGGASSEPALVEITVIPVNDAPTAAGDGYATDEDTQLSVVVGGVLFNDEDIDGDSLAAELVTGPAHGTLTLNGNGTFTYTPHANYNGADGFTYRAFDGGAHSQLATVEITVVPVNDVPVPAAQGYDLTTDVTLTVPAPGLLAGATDVEGDALSVVAYTQPAHGVVSVAPDGSFTYTLTDGFGGTDAFTYTVSDGRATATATVAINVQLAGRVILSGGNLYVFGTGAAESIQIAQSGGAVTVVVNGVPAGAFQPTGSVRVFAGDGADAVVVDPSVTLPVRLHGEGGNDSLVGGSGGDLLDGGEGDDSLVATTGNDTLAGGAGNDVLQAGAGADLLSGGDGDDSLVGLSGGDVLDGGTGRDTLRAGSGSDVLYGGDGDDSLVGGSGNDVVHAGLGNDTVTGGQGDDVLHGQGGDDRIEGGSGADVATGGAGNDTLVGDQGNDLLVGGLGSDAIYGNANEDILVAGYTDYDSDDVALRAILAAWNSADTYQNRVGAIQSASFSYRLLMGVTVHDDDAVDRLTGSAGWDWFFANLDGPGARDEIIDLGGEEES